MSLDQLLVWAISVLHNVAIVGVIPSATGTRVRIGLHPS
jgi:hypothetical protein